jgi:elongation factor 3
MSPVLTSQPTDVDFASILESLRSAPTGPGESKSDVRMERECNLLCTDAKAAADKLALAVSKAGIETLMSVAYPNYQWSS